MHIVSAIYEVGLSTSHASFFEVLHDVYIVVVCDIMLVILQMRLN
jgi:hypothetical protein